MENQATLSILQDVSANVIYLMGASFVIGSFFTILLLVLLDWARLNNNKSDRP